MKKMIRIFLMVFALLGVSDAYAQSAFDDPSIGAPSGKPGEAAGDLVSVESDVKGGSVGVGSSNQVVVLFRNEDTKDIEFQNIELYPSSNISSRVFNNECSKRPLTPGGECPIVITVQGVQSGAYRVAMVVGHSGRSRFKTANVSGTVEANQDTDPLQSELEISPSELDFEAISASRPIVRSVTLRNISTEPLTVENIKIEAGSGSGFTMNTDCEELKPGQACIANIIWAPSLEGPASGFLVVQHSGLTRVANVALDGEYTPEDPEEASLFPDTVPGKGLLISNLTEVAFGAGIESTSSVTVTLVNAGDTELELKEVGLAGSENGLVLARKGCRDGLVLQPTDACPLTVSWSPSREGQVLDNVQIYHTGARGVLVLPITGTATRAVNVETQAVVRKSAGVEVVEERTPTLDGFVITSHSPKLAIISGPGGSRVVRDGERIALGGFSWVVNIIPNGVQLNSGSDQVDLLFDSSLSSRNRASISSDDDVVSTPTNNQN